MIDVPNREIGDDDGFVMDEENSCDGVCYNNINKNINLLSRIQNHCEAHLLCESNSNPN